MTEVYTQQEKKFIPGPLETKRKRGRDGVRGRKERGEKAGFRR